MFMPPSQVMDPESDGGKVLREGRGTRMSERGKLGPPRERESHPPLPLEDPVALKQAYVDQSHQVNTSFGFLAPSPLSPL